MLGLFHAGAVDSKFIYLYREDVPYNITPITFRTLPCYDAYLNGIRASLTFKMKKTRNKVLRYRRNSSPSLRGKLANIFEICG